MTKKIMNLGLLMGLAVAMFSTAAYSDEPCLPRGQKGFTKIDVNNDGKIVLAEIEPTITKRFMKYDGNGDSAVSTAEIDKALMAALEKRRTRIMTNMDSDGNGTIDKAELDKYITAMLNGADTDHDGGVTLAEVAAFKVGKWRKTRLENQTN
jgi:Ca2+-binding EF-hand superfamily protein